jgi:hypothetical protein
VSIDQHTRSSEISGEVLAFEAYRQPCQPALDATERDLKPSFDGLDAFTGIPFRGSSS